MSKSGEEKYILSLDVGTTNVKAILFDSHANPVSSAVRPLKLDYLDNRMVEIDVDHVWQTVCIVVREAVSCITGSQSIAALGLSTNRNTFTVWNKETGKHYVPFITWMDDRASDVCKTWNDSWTLNGVRSIGRILHFTTRVKRFASMKMFKLSNQMVLPKLVWIFEKRPDILSDARENKVLYGTLDTWLAWKLTNGKMHATDPSNASVSGMYDPVTMSWSSPVLRLFGIPLSILPEVRDTNADFGVTRNDVIGFETLISAVIGDQQAAMFGECCFSPGDVKITLGTGSFVNMNTGSKMHTGFRGVYPVIGWKLRGDKEATYLTEAHSSGTGSLIEWARKCGFFNDYDDLSDLPETCQGLCFVPFFSGHEEEGQNEVSCDPTAIFPIIGIQTEYKEDNVLPAILESIAFRVKQLVDVTQNETEIHVKNISADGGVANNDFILQTIADLTATNISRDRHREMSCRGAAFLAGLSVKFWTDLDQLKSFSKPERTFVPGKSSLDQFLLWEKAVKRCDEVRQAYGTPDSLLTHTLVKY